MRFASELRETAFAAREGLDSTDARATARALLTMSVTDFQQEFRGSSMKRAKRRGLARNAAVVLGNVGTSEDAPLLEAALAHDEPLVREHAAWALARLCRLDLSATCDEAQQGEAKRAGSFCKPAGHSAPCR